MADSDCLHLISKHVYKEPQKIHVASKVYTKFTRLHFVISAAAVNGL
jgi:hypothetical protein